MSNVDMTKQVERFENTQGRKTTESRIKMTGAQAMQIREALEQLNATEPPPKRACTVSEFMRANADLLMALRRKGHSLDSIKGMFDAAGMPVTFRVLAAHLRRLKRDENERSQDVSPRDDEAHRKRNRINYLKLRGNTVSDIVERPNLATSKDEATEGMAEVGTF